MVSAPYAGGWSIPAEARREEQILDFFARWDRSWAAMCESFQLLADDCVWDQRPLPRLRGPRGARRFLALARAVTGLDTIEVEVLNLAVTGDVVHTERIDRLRRRDGSMIVSAPVAGVLTFSGDRLIHWREYFDSASFAGRTLTSGAAHLATAALGITRRWSPLPAAQVGQGQRGPDLAGQRDRDPQLFAGRPRDRTGRREHEPPSDGTPALDGEDDLGVGR